VFVYNEMITKRKSSLTALKGFVIVEACTRHREEETMREVKTVKLTMDQLATLLEALEQFDHTRLDRWELDGYTDGQDKSEFIDSLEETLKASYY